MRDFTFTNSHVAVISRQLDEIDPLVDQLVEAGIPARGFFNLHTAFESHQKKPFSAIVLCCEQSNDTIIERLRTRLPQVPLKLLVYAKQITDQTQTAPNTVFFKKQNPPQNLVEYLLYSAGTLDKPSFNSSTSNSLSTLDSTLGCNILNSIDDAIIALDVESRIEFFNTAAEVLLGIPTAQAYRLPIADLLDLRHPQTQESLLQQVLQKTHYQGLIGSTSLQHLPGFYASLETRAGQKHVVLVKGGRFYNALKGADDVLIIKKLTEKYQNELELREREHKYWSLVNTTHLGYCELDQEGKVVDANEDFLRITGFEQLEAILGIDAQSWLPDYEKERFIRESKKLIKSGKIISMEIDFLSANGKITPIEFSASVLKKNQEVRIIGVGRDISQRRQNEKEKNLIQSQLRQAQKMEAIGQLTGGIAHDFNNVLASILGYTELAQHLSDMADQDPFLNIKPFNKKLHAYLNAIHEAGDRARDLVKQLMIFSRHEENNLVPQATPVEPTVNEIVRLLTSTLPRSLQVSTHFEDKLPLIEIAPIQLHQIIMNLCINARDALNENGTITITATRKKQFAAQCASCHESFQGNFVELVVSDNGKGIATEHFNRIFEPFFTTKDIGQGTGMGLSIVHGIVHEHHGHIRVESSPDQGSAFHILLPAKLQDESESLPVIKETQKPFGETLLPSTGLSSGHIVIIDDEESLANFLSDLLSTQGYRVSTFTDSLKAKAELPAILDTVDLVLTDHTMPGITGSQLAQYLLKLKPELPIILCTGFSFSVDEKMAYQIGIRRFLHKPLSTRNLLKEINALLQSKILV